MKKNIKVVASLAFVALLAASCDGSAITKEEAIKRVKNIAEHESETATEVLEKGVHFSFKLKTVIESVTTSGSIDVYFAENYFHVSSSAKIDGDNTKANTKADVYLGQKDNDFYAIDAANKKYAVLTSADAANLIGSVKSLVDDSLEEGSSSSLSSMLATFPQSSSTTEIAGYKHVYEMKSKGEGHLYLKSVRTYTGSDDESKKSESSTKVVVDNYRLSSFESLTSVLNSYISVKANAKYSISKSLPNVNGMEKVASIEMPSLVLPQ